MNGTLKQIKTFIKFPYMRKALREIKLGQFHIYIVARLGGGNSHMREMPVYLSSLLWGWNYV